MSTGTRYTPAQIRGVTSTGGEGGAHVLDEPGEWTEDLDESIYGEQVWTLPGMGERGDRCGEWVPKSFCEDAAEKWGTEEETHDPVDLGQHHCGRRACPNDRCWSGKWARERTVAGVSRLGAARHIQHPRAVHCALSPDEGSVTTIQGVYDARSKAIEIAKDHGIRGGVLVFHGFRVKERFQELFRAKKERGQVEGGIWQWIRENSRDWRDQVYWSPHFHVLGLARDVEGREREDGWIVENIERNGSHSLDPFEIDDLDGYDDMAGALRYLLSHATIERGSDRRVISWFGELHSTNFCPDPEDARERKTEPKSGPLKAEDWKQIRETAEEVVGATDDRDQEDGHGGGDEDERCDVEGCDGHVHSIYEANDYLEQRESHLTIEAITRLQTAYDWAIGYEDEEPDDGWPRPQNEEEADLALERLV
jgi:hypothetical protein